MARDRPAVLTRADISAYLADVDSDRNLERTIDELNRLGWLLPLHMQGVWAYLPPGEEEVIDPYVDLRGWKARNPGSVFALAGEAAAWHLGYIDRAFDGPVALWLPAGTRLPFGLRPHFSVVRLGWVAEDAPRLEPTSALLHKRSLDLTRWAGGLPALGPEAMIVQLSARPSSFRAWTDLLGHLEDLASDAELARLKELLEGQSSSAWQRAAYLLHTGRRAGEAAALLEHRPRSAMPKVQFGKGAEAVWVPEFRIIDRLIAPLLRRIGKA